MTSLDLCEACEAPPLTLANNIARCIPEGLAVAYKPKGGCACYVDGPNPNCKVCWPDYDHCQPCGELHQDFSSAPPLVRELQLEGGLW